MAFQREVEGFNSKHHTATRGVLASPMLACTSQHTLWFVFRTVTSFNPFLQTGSRATAGCWSQQPAGVNRPTASRKKRFGGVVDIIHVGGEALD